MTVFSLLSLPCTPPGFPKFLRAAPNARQCLGVKGVAGSMENPAQRVPRGFARPAGDGREGKNPVLCSFSPRGGPGRGLGARGGKTRGLLFLCRGGGGGGGWGGGGGG